MGQWRQANTGLQRYQRVATSVPVRVSTVDAETDPITGKTFFRSAEETTANLSRGGAYLRSWEPLAVGRRVIVSFDLASNDSLQLVGRVVWTRRKLRPEHTEGAEAPGYAIEFVGGSSRERSRLDRFVNSLEIESKTRSTVGSTDTSDSSATPAAAPRP